MKFKMAMVCPMLCTLLLMTGAVFLASVPVRAATQTAAQSVASPRMSVQTGHGGWVMSIAVSPDGKSVVSGSFDATLKVWDVATGRELRTLLGHKDLVNGVAFSSDGKTVASGSKDKTIKLWDVSTGQELHTLVGHEDEVTSLAFSGDGKTLVSGSTDETLKLWDVSTGRLLRTIAEQGNAVTGVAFFPDGKSVVSASWGKLQIWDVATARKVLTLEGHKGNTTGVSVSRDGKTIVSGGLDKAIKFWNVATGRELRTLLGHSDTVTSVAFSPNGKTIVSASGSLTGESEDKTVKLWDVATGKALLTLNGHSETVASVAFTPDGKTVISGSYDESLKSWDATSGVEQFTFNGRVDTTFSVAVSPNEAAIVMGGVSAGSKAGSLKLWNVTAGQVRQAVSGKLSFSSVAFSPDSKSVVVGTGSGETPKLLDVATGRELRPLARKVLPMSPQTFAFLRGPASIVAGSDSVAFSPDGKSVVAGSHYGTLNLWDVASGRTLRTFVDDGAQVTSVAFSPDGKILVSGSETPWDEKYTVKIWSVASGKKLHAMMGHGGTVHSIAISPDGKNVVSGSQDNTVKLWNLSSGRELRSFKGHKSAVASVALSPDGKTVVSGSLDKTLILWDVSTGRQLHTFTGHENEVKSVAFSLDGKTVLSSSLDKTVKLWRVSDGALLATLTNFSDGRWAVTSPDGRFDVADLEDMPHLHWVMPDDPMTPLPVETFMRDYYEPRLLPRILKGEKFKPVRALGELNRVQPEVTITSIEADQKQTGYVTVTLEAKGVSRRYGFSDKAVATAAHDLRLFRNGQLVGYAEGKLADFGGKPFLRTFNVRLPAGKAPLNFTAYAFNDDRVKSATARKKYTPPLAIVSAKPRAYLITVGVNRHDNPGWDLRYAANDARQISISVSTLLKKQGTYEAVITIPLISDAEGSKLATKANLKAVLDALAGRKADVGAIPGGDQLHQATPDDLVLISFSGHGYGEEGIFFLIPGDTGAGQGMNVTSELMAHSISSDELSTWLRDVDAGDMAMIVDACHSAASVGDEFKPGPMGSRGLGQLAFDKGMRILAASQADDVALESDLIKQGLLSFALVQNGLQDHQADHKPKDKKITLEEWLSYGVSRVPSLAEEVRTGKVVAARGTGDNRGAVRISGGESMKKRVLQQPSLFDFTKGRRDVVLETGVTSAGNVGSGK